MNIVERFDSSSQIRFMRSISWEKLPTAREGECVQPVMVDLHTAGKENILNSVGAALDFPNQCTKKGHGCDCQESAD